MADALPNEADHVVRSGPPTPDLPYRWGCSCGAIWNSNLPDAPTGALCGPSCDPTLFEIHE